MFIVVLFVITKMQKQPRHLPTDERIKRDTSIQMEYYLVIKRSTIHLITWRMLKNILLSERVVRSQSQDYLLYDSINTKYPEEANL